jgi:hypothetical protein
MSRATILSLLTAAAALSACTPTLGPPPPAVVAPPPSSTFRAADFAWSSEAGQGGITGRVVYRDGKTRYSCAHATVVLTPETAWTRHRMSVLYRSTEAAAEPADAVRARTPQAPAGDYSAFVRRTTCDAANHFAFSGLPDGAWYAITIAKPVGGEGAGVALMKRVTTHAGHVTPLTF